MTNPSENNLKTAEVTTSYGRTYEVNYTNADFIEWLKHTKIPIDDAYFLLIEYLSEKHQELFYLDGEMIEDIDFEISKELEEEIEFIKTIKQINL